MHSYGAVPFVRIVIPFAAGILIYALWQIHVSPLLLVITLAFTIILQRYLKSNSRRLFRNLPWIGVGLNLCLLFTGNQFAYFKADINRADHFLRDSSEHGNAIVTLLEPPVEKDHSYKALVSVMYISGDDSSSSVRGRAIIYFSKDTAASHLRYGDVVMIPHRFTAVAPPLNPDEFDYRKYLWFQEIYATEFVKSGDWIKIRAKQGNRLLTLSFWLRDKCREAFQKYIPADREEAVMEALVVGYRDGMSQEVQQAYANAGVVHILAVSGLHVGILYLVFDRMLFFMRRRKNWKRWQSFFIVVLIWLFAFVTGLSGSVIRAATMFSLIALGKNWNRSANSFNTIAASAFLILLWNPFLLMDVGFQLSYAAVISISAFVPYMNWWMTRETRLGDSLWRTTSMSLAAQTGTLPLTLFYFKQFPVLFLLANIIVIPLSGVLLVGGMALAIFQWTGLLAAYLGIAIAKLCWLMNAFILFISAIPVSVIHLGSFTWWEAALLLAVIALLTQYFLYHRRIYFYSSLLCLCILCISSSVTRIVQQISSHVTVYAFRGSSTLELNNSVNGLLLTDSSVIADMWRMKYLRQHNQWNGISNLAMVGWSNNQSKEFQFNGRSSFFTDGPYFQFKDYRIVRITRPLPTHIASRRLKLDAVIISGNPDITMSQLLKCYDPAQIILDGSNKFYRTKKWIHELDTLRIPCHDVMKDGAWLVDL